MRLPQPQELVDAAKQALGVTTDEDLALELRLRYGVRPSQSLINRWANGNAEPSYKYAVPLFHAAGWLNVDATPLSAETVFRIDRLAEELQEIRALLEAGEEGTGSA